MPKTTVAIIGAGQFGQVLIKLLSEHAPELDLVIFETQVNSDLIKDVEHLKECDIVLPAVPINAFEQVIKQIAPHLKQDAQVIDVCSIKQHPVDMMLKHLPEKISIIATHPMFGPESLAAANWELAGLPLVIWPVRVDDTFYQPLKQHLEDLGLKVLEMKPEEHDAFVARSQFLSLLMGSILKNIAQHTPIDTPSFQQLWQTIQMTQGDYQILLDAYKYNTACQQVFKQIKETIADFEKEAKS